ncbi:MAG TPA: DNA recombination protein RmuC [Fibrobacter sp.]|nr:DNA recombination protein RmuC [Fibrobacter sp.]
MLITILVINSVILVAIFLFLFLRPSENEKVIRELQSAFAQFTSIFDQSARSNREEQNNSITRLSGEVGQTINQMRETMERRFQSIQSDNNEKLEKMRLTVDEKLHKTLETRLGESFKIVSDRLEQVQKGLVEMQTLASGVGDLKRVLSNVKTKGVLGEYQLASILEQMLTHAQYEQNVKTKKGSNNIVEFAVKIPSKSETEDSIWLPIDAKFPSDDYERLLNAYDEVDVGAVEEHKKKLEVKIKNFAKDIKEKYIDPPHTTDFAILFLPFEGLYAEVLRIPGLFEYVQRNYKITIVGPTTISAFLSSLQIGFRSLAVEKRTSEIWELLGAVRTEFEKFGLVLENVKSKLDLASREIDQAGVRSRAIERQLKNVQSLPESQATAILGESTSL